MNQNLVFKLGGSLVVALLIFVSGWQLGVRSTRQSEADLVYAIINGEVVKGAAVASKIEEDLKQIERQKYLVKRRAVEEMFINRGREAEPPLNLDEIALDEEALRKFAAERGISLAHIAPKAKSDLIGNFKIHTQMLARKSKEEAALKASAIEWYIPMPFLGPAVKVGKGFIDDLANKSAPKTVVVFANYHCPYCAEANKKIQALKEKYGDGISIRFRFNLIDPETSAAFQTSIAGACAADQGKFAEFSKAAVDNPPLDGPSLTAVAQSVRLDETKFKTCMDAQTFKKDVLADNEEAQKLGVAGAATAFINGRKVQIQDSFEIFQAMLNQPAE